MQCNGELSPLSPKNGARLLLSLEAPVSASCQGQAQTRLSDGGRGESDL